VDRLTVYNQSIYSSTVAVPWYSDGIIQG